MNAKQRKLIEEKGFTVPDINTIEEGDNLDGLILNDGTYISCEGYNKHRYIYPFLYSIKLVADPDWTSDKSAIHISSSQLTGRVISHLSSDARPNLATDKQLNTLFALRKHLESYRFGEKVSDLLYQHHCRTVDSGGKYNGLSFLNKYYPSIRIPEFSKRIKDISPRYFVCLRTSPVHSMPGLLNSKFNVVRSKYIKEVAAIKKEFKAHIDLIEGNKLHYFFQQQLNGINGVCNVRGRKRIFNYAASHDRGAIVQGKKGNVKLQDKHVLELRNTAIELAKDFKKSIQLEFVISNDMVYIVQFRILKNEPEETVLLEVPKDALAYGKTFCSSSPVDVNVNDIAIVNKDGDSSLLLGKKALIVTSNVEFSHLLALSKVLKIPSMYGTGKIDFSGKKQIKFVAYNETSWICG